MKIITKKLKLTLECLVCKQEFRESYINLAHRKHRPFLTICNPCYKPIYFKEIGLKNLGKKRPIIIKPVVTFEQELLSLNPRKYSLVSATCPKCSKSYESKFHYIKTKYDKYGQTYCHSCMFSITGNQSKNRLKNTFPKEILEYYNSFRPVPLTLARKTYDKKDSHLPVIFECENCQETVILEYSLIKQRRWMGERDLCKKCYSDARQNIPESLDIKRKAYEKRKDRPISVGNYRGYYQSKWGKLYFESLSGELLFLVNSEKEEFLHTHIKKISRYEDFIPYVTSGRTRSYYPDYFVEYNNRNSQIIEIKGWQRNPQVTLDKANSAKAFCKSKGWYYKIIDSKDLDKPSKHWLEDIYLQGKLEFTNPKHELLVKQRIARLI